MTRRHVTTPPARPDAVVPGDLDEHRCPMSDPGTWAHLPSRRHTSPERTAAGIGHPVRHRARDGLGYWTARLREDLPEAGLAAGQVVGTGGCTVREGTSWWNLHHRSTGELSRWSARIRPGASDTRGRHRAGPPRPPADDHRAELRVAWTSDVDGAIEPPPSTPAGHHRPAHPSR